MSRSQIEYSLDADLTCDLLFADIIKILESPRAKHIAFPNRTTRNQSNVPGVECTSDVYERGARENSRKERLCYGESYISTGMLK